MKVSSNVVGGSDDQNNFPHKLLLANTQVSRLHKAFANNCSTNITLSKTQLHKIGEAERFLDSLLGPLLKTGLHLMKNVIKSLGKSVLVWLELTAPASARDPASHKKFFGSSMTTLIISNEEIWYHENRRKALVKQLKKKQ